MTAMMMSLWLVGEASASGPGIDLFTTSTFASNFYCDSWPGPGIWIGVWVGNDDNDPSRGFYVDLFQDLPSPPSPGQLSDNYAWVTGLGGRDDGLGWSKWAYFQLDAYDGWSGWLDVSVDSTQGISETDESNNIRSRYVTVDCSNGS